MAFLPYLFLVRFPAVSGRLLTPIKEESLKGLYLYLTLFAYYFKGKQVPAFYEPSNLEEGPALFLLNLL